MVAGFLLSGVCKDRKGLGSSLGVSECLREQVLLMTLTLGEVLAVLLGLGAAEVAAVLAHTPGPCRAPPETERETSPALMRSQLVTS